MGSRMDVRLKNKFIYQPVFNPYFTVSLGLYTGLYFLKIMEVFYLPNWVRNYAGDVLCLPIVLSLSLAILRRVRTTPTMLLSPLNVAVAFVYVSVLFEGVLPYYSSNYVADVFDLVAYGCGAIIYYLIQHFVSKRNFPCLKRLSIEEVTSNTL